MKEVCTFSFALSFPLKNKKFFKSLCNSGESVTFIELIKCIRKSISEEYFE